MILRSRLTPPLPSLVDPDPVHGICEQHRLCQHITFCLSCCFLIANLNELTNPSDQKDLPRPNGVTILLVRHGTVPDAQTWQILYPINAPAKPVRPAARSRRESGGSLWHQPAIAARIKSLVTELISAFTNEMNCPSAIT
jgi:hypothetical protein